MTALLLRRGVGAALVTGVVLAGIATPGTAEGARRRASALPRARAAMVQLDYRYASLAVDGGWGPLHAFALGFAPVSRMRGPARFVHWRLLAEGGFRPAATGDRNDGLFLATMALGGQYPVWQVVPYASVLVGGGLATRYRFGEVIASSAWLVGAEAGIDFRAVGPLGLLLAVGGGRTTVADQWSWSGWVRVGLALF